MPAVCVMDDTLQLGFPLGIRLTHFFNFLFITLLIRSGIEIIGAHPKFYWRDDSLPGENNLGLGRHWNFWGVNGWLLAGLIYVVLLFATPQCRRLLPTSWDIFP